MLARSLKNFSILFESQIMIYAQRGLLNNADQYLLKMVKNHVSAFEEDGKV